jgi:hypothetical protein
MLTKHCSQSLSIIGTFSCLTLEWNHKYMSGRARDTWAPIESISSRFAFDSFDSRRARNALKILLLNQFLIQINR